MGDPLLNAAMAVHMHAELAAMQARAEQAERDLALVIASNDRYGAQLDSMTATIKALNARLAESNACIERLQTSLDELYHPRGPGKPNQTAREVVQRLMARLAEVGPVVEAAEALSDAWAKFDTFYDMHETMDNRACVDRIALLDNAVSALRAARSLRGAGEGGGA